MRKILGGILFVLAVIALVSVASAAEPVLPLQVTATITHPGPQSYFGVDVTNGGIGDLPNKDYIGFCADSRTGQRLGSFDFKVYSSLKPLPATLPYVDWNKVNYVINHKNGSDKYTLQAVIWHYDGGPHAWGTVDQAKYDELVADADANGGSFIPDYPQKFAVILWSSRLAQPVFVEVPVPPIDGPEFPTLALPVAMIIGVVGAVQFFKSRKD